MPEPGTEKPDAKYTVEMYDNSPCGRDPYDDKGLCICHSEHPNKDRRAFWDMIRETLGEKKYDFTRFVFPPDAEFGDKDFQEPVSFVFAKFTGRAHFLHANFRKEADFRLATFGGLADFYEATFKGRTNFFSATFDDRVQFSGATFEDEAEFYEARFQGAADFRHATFERQVRFWRGFPDHEVFSTRADTDFRRARFHQPEKVLFQRVFLGQTRFLETDVRKVHFADVKWAERSGGRPAVWDELAREDDGEDKNHALIAQLYRQLKYNYEEEQRDPITAGEFHFGEMEMRRLEKPPKNRLLRFFKRNVSFLALYRWISGYGEDYIQALACIVGVILAFAVVFAYIPVFALEPSPSSTASQSMHSLGSRLIYSAMCFLLRGDRPLQPVYPPGYYWSVAEGVIGPPLIALFVLALNRRFKR